MMDESQYIAYEASLNEAQDKYFNARPQLLRTGEKEKIFEAGFRLAYSTRKGEDNE